MLSVLLAKLLCIHHSAQSQTNSFRVHCFSTFFTFHNKCIKKILKFCLIVARKCSHLSAENESAENKQNEIFFTSLRLGFHHTWNYWMPLNFTHKRCTFVAHEILHLIYVSASLNLHFYSTATLNLNDLNQWRLIWTIYKRVSFFRVEFYFLLHRFCSLPLPRLIRTQALSRVF